MIIDEVKSIVVSATGNDSVEITRTNTKFGHFATNIAMKLAKSKGENPRQLAEEIVMNIIGDPKVASAEVAGPGFINIRLTDEYLLSALGNVIPKVDTYKDKVVVTEYSDPNPFKELHIGHLYTTIIGDAISNLIAYAGGDVHKVNFGGDVGMHVAKAMFAITKATSNNPEELAKIKSADRPSWMSKCYVEGAKAFEDDAQAQEQIKQINKRIYKLLQDGDKESDFAKYYWTCRKWSYEYFNEFYSGLNTTFEKYYPESENAILGADTVKKHVGDVYSESDGAIVFRGEKYGLHTRVFINNEGLPTYEAKDIGLALAKKRDYNFDQTVIITGNDIAEYMKVVVKSLEQFEPEIAKGTVHITHGQVKMSGSIKMSSRLGNVLAATDVIETVRNLVKEQQPESKVDSAIAAIKYGFLKQSIGPDVIFDAKESVSLEGKSGPYLQYAYARACSLLDKSGKANLSSSDNLEDGERELLLKITENQDVLTESVHELAPHKFASYLYELTQSFNRFYENNRVSDSDRKHVRIKLVEKYRDVLQNGLKILNIEAPDKM